MIVDNSWFLFGAYMLFEERVHAFPEKDACF